MPTTSFDTSARFIAARNLTPNVAGVGATFDDTSGQLHVTYYLIGPASDEDEEERELTVGELIAEFPEIRTASSTFGSVDDMRREARARLVFVRG